MLIALMAIPLVLAEQPAREGLPNLKATAIFSNLTSAELVGELAALYKIRISFEEPAKEMKMDGTGKPSPATSDAHEELFDVTLTNRSLADSLSRLVAVDKRFIWKWDQKNKTINVLPAAGSVLQWKIESVTVNDDTLKSLLLEKDSLGFRKHGIEVELGKDSAWLNAKLALTLKDVSAEAALNEICAQLPFEARWEVLRSGRICRLRILAITER